MPATPVPRTDADVSDESIALLALGSMRGIGYRVLRRIYEAGIPFAKVLAESNEAHLRDLLSTTKLKTAKVASQTITLEREPAREHAVSMLRRLGELNIRLIHTFEQEFPASLRSIAHPPGWIFVEGRLDVLQRPLIAIVGTRNPTPVGRFLTECVCRLLTSTDIGTVSGLADGIDAKVHELSLALRIPTVAVLGTGILRDYPAHSRPMRDAIVVRGGCILSEYLPDDGPAKENFVWRNRLQAGLGDMVVPTEWQLKSGTAHTVNFALQAKKPVVAVDAASAPPETSKFLMDHGNQRFRLPHESAELLDYICRVFE
jgi:DNA processing protein